VSLVYVYAIGRDARVPPGIRGLDDGPVRAEGAAGLVAFVSDVPEDEFAEAPLNAHLSDLDWLTPRAVRHQEVNALLASAVDPLAPLSFGTVFRDPGRVRAMLEARAAELAPRLDALAGKAEWIAVLRRDEQAARAAVDRDSDALRTVRDEMASAPPGRAYLIGRRLEETARRELRAWDAAAAAAAVAALEAAGARLYRELLVEDAGAGMLARWSALAGRDREPDLTAAAEAVGREWGARGYALELSGPWPAYRFAAVAP
jgi:hypothetical protein